MTDSALAWLPDRHAAAQVELRLRELFGMPGFPLSDDDQTLQIWNDIDRQNRFDLFQADGIVECIQVRIDARHSTPEGRLRVIRLATELDCVFVSRAPPTFIQPTAEPLLAALAASRAVQFCADPEGYLRAAAKKLTEH